MIFKTVADPYWRVNANGDPWPGCAPGRAVTFFCVAKRKSPKKRPPPLPAPSASATGTCGARFRWGLAKLASLKQTPALIHPKLRSSAHLEGDPGYGIGGAQRRIAPRARMPPSLPSPGGGRGKTVNTLTHRGAHRHFSRPHRGRAGVGAPRALGAMPGAAGPIPRWGPPLYAPRSAAAGGSGLALFERSEFSQTPHAVSTAGSRSASEGRGQWGWPFFWFLFFGQAKKRDCAAGRTPRPTMQSDKPTP